VDPAYLGLEDAEGAVITSLERKGPADKAGLRAYDIVTEFNGRKIKSSVDLMDSVADAKIGSTASVKAIRERKPITARVAITERPDFNQAKNAPAPGNYKGQKAPFNLGFSMADLTPELRTEYMIPPDVQNPMIIEVERGSLASMSNLRVGDLILDVNKKEVIKALDVSKALQKGTNTLRLARGNRLLIVSFDSK